MRNALRLWVLALALSSPAVLAQFQNRSIGAQSGFWSLPEPAGLDWAIPLGLFATTYFDNGIEGTVHMAGSLVRQRATGYWGLGGSGEMGARYLFVQGDRLRPTAGLHVAYLYVGMPNISQHFVGVGPELGVEYFFTDGWSVGIRGEYNVYFEIGRDFMTSWGLNLELGSWY